MQSNGVVAPTPAKVPQSYDLQLMQCHRLGCAAKVGNGRCDSECDLAACGFDNGECSYGTRPWARCEALKMNVPCDRWYANGHCDKQCNSEGCLFDGWDCVKGGEEQKGCPDEAYCVARWRDGRCDKRCNSPGCDWDGGDCRKSVDLKVSAFFTSVQSTKIRISRCAYNYYWRRAAKQRKLFVFANHFRLHSQQNCSLTIENK